MNRRPVRRAAARQSSRGVPDVDAELGGDLRRRRRRTGDGRRRGCSSGLCAEAPAASSAENRPDVRLSYTNAAVRAAAARPVRRSAGSLDRGAQRKPLELPGHVVTQVRAFAHANQVFAAEGMDLSGARWSGGRRRSSPVGGLAASTLTRRPAARSCATSSSAPCACAGSSGWPTSTAVWRRGERVRLDRLSPCS